MIVYPYFFLAVVACGWLAAMVRGPVYALLAYVFIYFNIPAKQWWGAHVPDLRWSYSGAIVIVVSMVLHHLTLRNRPFESGLGTRALTAYLLLMLVTVPFAAFPDLALTRVYDFFRYVAIFAIIVAIVDSIDKLRAFLWMFIIQVGWISWSARSYFTGARLDGVGPGDAGDANGLAVLALSAVPFLLVFLRRGKKVERVASLLLLPVILNCFVMTRSRGGFIGMAVALVLFFVLERDKKIKRLLVLLSCGAMAMVFILADQSFKDRLLNLSRQDISSEEAGAGRVGIWKYGVGMVKDYPLGAGGWGFLYLSPDYLPEELIEKNVGLRASHNTVLLVLVEQGVVGLVLFLLLTYQLIACCRKAKAALLRDTYTVPPDGDQLNVYVYANASLATICAIFAAGLFTDRLYYEGLYFMGATCPVLFLLARRMKDGLNE